MCVHGEIVIRNASVVDVLRSQLNVVLYCCVTLRFLPCTVYVSQMQTKCYVCETSAILLASTDTESPQFIRTRQLLSAHVPSSWQYCYVVHVSIAWLFRHFVFHVRSCSACVLYVWNLNAQLYKCIVSVIFTLTVCAIGANVCIRESLCRTFDKLRAMHLNSSKWRTIY